MDIRELWENYEPILLQIGLTVLAAVFLLVVGFWLINWLARQLNHLMDKRNVDISVSGFLTSFIKIGLKVLLLLSIAGMFGVETTSFIAILSALSLAVGLALQGNLGHFASGILLLTFRPFKVGDVIATNGFTATVKEITVFHTILNAVDNRLIIIPNGKVMGNAIENYTAQGVRRLDLTFGIGYGDDIDKARAVITKTVEETPGILLDRGVDIFVRTLNDSSVDLACRAWAENPNYWAALIHLNEQVKKAFDREGISIPFPQRDVHIKRSDAVA
ncbi:small conductance mechanosensitive channel [Lewinella marina]|uniref:Mechanosensitive ion channel protein n=1 Tax=Neolewinella marina TaxID=438751 RepID=A0A2G0CGW8_9BACT|nr:mechanosensitive ion channel domain-containing protein [Neolewinella marina]NJB86307.1 small conductance mechanosensitive channel [Neolewinella marina]PHK99222.1 mechanosensitive ion channel protein [Neolewinella marina]